MLVIYSLMECRVFMQTVAALAPYYGWLAQIANTVEQCRCVPGLCLLAIVIISFYIGLMGFRAIRKVRMDCCMLWIGIIH